MESDSDRLSGFLVSEMIHAFAGIQARHGFTVITRAQLDLLLAQEQLEFDMSEYVDENTAQRIGQFLGVQFIVAGEFEPIVDFFRFRARVIEVETAAIRGSYAANVRNDVVIASLRGAVVAALGQATAPAGMVRVEGGTMRIGGRDVTLSAFNIGRHPVTQGEWFDVMGSNPSFFQGNELAAGVNWRNLPVEDVSWFEAVEFANARSRRAGLTPAYAISGSGANRVVTWNRNANGYRLPTEAEWEFAARGGMVCRGNFEFSGGNVAGEVGWYRGNSMDRTHEVGLLRPNALGIYDMSGNVSEWVWDWSSLVGTRPTVAETNPVEPEDSFSDSFFRESRGGSWSHPAEFLRSAFQSGRQQARSSHNLGLRLVRP